jgi:ElaB/YqjD/DUF883 family membrane-anchored ribosome-binding protein
MKGMLAEMRQTMGDEMRLMSGQISKPLEETSRKSGDTVEALAERISAILDEVAERLVRETDNFSRGAGVSAAAIKAMVAKLEAMQTPENIIEIKLAPMIQGLTRAVNAFAKSAEIHEKTVDKSLKRTQDVAAAVVHLVDELRAAQPLGMRNVDNQGPWGPVPSDKAAE